MNKYTVIGLAVGFFVGLFVGYQMAARSSSGAVTVAAPVPQMPPMAPPAAEGAQARIATLQTVVARDPKNVAAWVQLGNDYFDLHQPQKAVEAYGRALELKPNDPNVLTDQGVMYRELRQFDNALQNFQKANQADPKHAQSLFNMGVVYAQDLKQPQKAVEAWNRVIAIAPESTQAAQARQAIAEFAGK